MKSKVFVSARAWALCLLLTLVTPLVSLPVPARGQQKRRSRPDQHRTTKRPSGLHLQKINDPNAREPVGPHSQGEAVVRAAILLGRLKFSPGEMSKTYTNNLAKAISAFQSASGLPITGAIDAATWNALNDDQSKLQVEQKQGQPGQNQSNLPQGAQQRNPGNNPSPAQAINSYIIAMEDIAGPFTRIPRVTGRGAAERLMLREAKLKQLNYESPMQLLAEKFHSSPRLLVALNPGKRFDKAGEKIEVPNVLAPEPGQAAQVVVDGSTRSVTAWDGNGKILAFYPATVGSEHDPLPVGNWTITEVTWYPRFKYNPKLFWDAENKYPRASLPPGAKSPVGVVWIGLSKKHYGIHGTPDPSKIGVTQSHGCIRLTNWDAAELGKIVKVGTPAVLKDSAPSETSRNPQNKARARVRPSADSRAEERDWKAGQTMAATNPADPERRRCAHERKKRRPGMAPPLVVPQTSAGYDGFFG